MCTSHAQAQHVCTHLAVCHDFVQHWQQPGTHRLPVTVQQGGRGGVRSHGQYHHHHYMASWTYVSDTVSMSGVSPWWRHVMGCRDRVHLVAYISLPSLIDARCALTACASQAHAKLAELSTRLDAVHGSSSICAMVCVCAGRRVGVRCSGWDGSPVCSDCSVRAWKWQPMRDGARDGVRAGVWGCGAVGGVAHPSAATAVCGRWPPWRPGRRTQSRGRPGRWP